MGKQKSEFEKKFEALSNVGENELFGQHYHTKKSRQAKYPKGYFERRFIGVVKWFDTDKGKDGLGYVVTNDLGFEKWDKRGSDFVEHSFTKKCCRDGIVPREHDIVVFRMGVAEGRRCVVELRLAQFNEDDFKLALLYTGKHNPTISGMSNKSNWRCNVHILSALLQCALCTEENLTKVKGWIESYLFCLPDDARNLAIDAWRSDGWFAERLRRWFADDVSIIASIKHKGSDDTNVDGNFEKHVSSIGLEAAIGGAEPCVDKDVEQRLKEDVVNENEEIEQPQEMGLAFERAFDKMYVSKVFSRLRELDNPSDVDKRRWVWELVQNAKDSIAKNPDRESVCIDLEINGDEVKFIHDGDPFTPDSIYGLMYEYSEDKQNRESTGQFGTGFLTTHCLSKNVSLNSDVIFRNGVCNGFSVTMFRQGDDDYELFEGAEAMRKSRKYFKNPFGLTTYTYVTTSSNGREAARLGAQEMRENACASMLFCDRIKQIRICENGSVFVVEKKADLTTPSGIRCVTFCEERDGIRTNRCYLVRSVTQLCEKLPRKKIEDKKLSVDVAIEVTIEKSVVDQSGNTTVYCVFPLVGIKRQLNEPVLVNSPDFEPGTERQYLLLKGEDFKGESEVLSCVGINRRIFEMVPQLYFELVQYLVENSFTALYNLASGLKEVLAEDHLDSDWYQKNVQRPCRKILSEAKVVSNYATHERMRLRDALIATDGEQEKEDRLWKLLNRLDDVAQAGSTIEDNHCWAEKIWLRDDEMHVWGIDDLCRYVSGKQNWDEMTIKDSGGDISSWYNKFLECIEEERIFNEYAVLPDMEGRFHKLKEEDFKQGENLNHVIVDLLKDLGCDIGRFILNHKITTIKLPRKYNSQSFSAEINRLVKATFNEQGTSNQMKIKKLLRFCSIVSTRKDLTEKFRVRRSALRKLIPCIFRTDPLPYVEDDTLLESAWEAFDDWILPVLAQEIALRKSLKGMTNDVFDSVCNVRLYSIAKDEAAAMDILNELYSALRNDGVAYDALAIFPCQSGTFMLRSQLQRQDGKIDSQLRDVAKQLEPNCGDYDLRLMDARCSRDVQPEQCVGYRDVCGFVDDAVFKKYSDQSKWVDEKFRNIVRFLLDDWMYATYGQGGVSKLDFPMIAEYYNEILLNVVHTAEERQYSNAFLKICREQNQSPDSILAVLKNGGALSSRAIVQPDDEDTSGLEDLVKDINLSAEQRKDANVVAQEIVKNCSEYKGHAIEENKYHELVVDGRIRIHVLSAGKGLAFVTAYDWRMLKEPNWRLCIVSRYLPEGLRFIDTQDELKELIGGDAIVVQAGGDNKFSSISQYFKDVQTDRENRVHAIVRIKKDCSTDDIFVFREHDQMQLTQDQTAAGGL